MIAPDDAVGAETPAEASAEDVALLLDIYEARLFGHVIELAAADGATDEPRSRLFTLCAAVNIAERIAELRNFPCMTPTTN